MIGIDKRDLFKLKSQQTRLDAVLSEVPVHGAGGGGVEERVRSSSRALAADGCKGMTFGSRSGACTVLNFTEVDVRWIFPCEFCCYSQETL